jgi:hypothetical protein
MLKPSFVLAVGMLAVSLGGCGGASATAVTLDGGHFGFITGDVDGVTVRAEMMASAGIKGVADGLIYLNASTTSVGLGWTLYVENSTGTTMDSPNYIALFEPDRTLRSDSDGATASVTVTAAAPSLGDNIAGTFTATLATKSTPPETVVVTNGAFEVRRNRE